MTIEIEAACLIVFILDRPKDAVVKLINDAFPQITDEEIACMWEAKIETRRVMV